MYSQWDYEINVSRLHFAVNNALASRSFSADVSA